MSEVVGKMSVQVGASLNYLFGLLRSRKGSFPNLYEIKKLFIMIPTTTLQNSSKFGISFLGKVKDRLSYFLTMIHTLLTNLHNNDLTRLPLMNRWHIICTSS
jgi:hypothetical protein